MVCDDISSTIVDHVRAICTGRPIFSDEADFHNLFACELPESSCNVSTSFAPPRIPPLRPTFADIEECQRKGKPLPPKGKDPCRGKRTALDVLWHRNGYHIPIELKYRPHWNSDVYGYGFLKDLHRLERLQRPIGQWKPTKHRYAVFLTPVPDYWTTGPSREPEPFRLTEGRSIPAGYWVQYNQSSAATRWYDYPPFFLCNSYTLLWHDIGKHGRCLVVRVKEQRCD